MDGRRDRQRLAGQVDAREHLARFGDPRQPLGEDLRIDMVEVEVDMVLVRADAAALADLDRHRARDDVAAGEVLGARRVALHEALALRIGEIAALAARALGDQHAGAVNAGRVELDELHVLQRQAGAQHHAAAVAGAGMGRGRGEIGAAVAAGRQHHRLARGSGGSLPSSRQSATTPRHAPSVHDQVEREIFDEEIGVVAQALLVERVQHRMAGAVGGGAGALRRRPLAHILHHAAERALVDLALGGAAERHAGMFELVDRGRRLAHHIFDRVLVAEPVGALDRVVHVPGPVVRPHIAEAGGDPALRRDGVAAGREHLGDAGGLQPPLRRAHRRAQPRAAGADDDHVIVVVDDLVGGGRGGHESGP